MEPQTIDTDNPQEESEHDQSISGCQIVFGLSDNPSLVPVPLSSKPPSQLSITSSLKLGDNATSNSLQVHLDSDYTLNGLPSFVSLDLDNTTSAVTTTHISQQSHPNADNEPIELSMSEESDSVPSEDMQSISHPALHNVETEYNKDMIMTQDTLNVVSEDVTAQLTEINVHKLRSNSVDAEISDDSDDYQIKDQPAEIDTDLNEKCNEIRRGFTNSYIQFKWQKLIGNHLFYARIPTCILALLLLFLSVTYCIGQTCETQLDLITKCEPKTREEIWQHSGDVQLRNSQNKTERTRESQYGWTDEACWSTKASEINMHTLWRTSKYKYEWVEQPLNVKTVLFGLISLYCLVIILYGVGATINDIIDVKNNTLHQRASSYRYQHAKVTTECQSYFNQMRAFYSAHLSADAVGWIIMMFGAELIEIILQYQALYLYNGYNVFDTNNEKDVYLANKPQFIVIFAAILAFNLFGSGLCWVSYVLGCRGLRFKLTLFYVDQFSDFFYTLFPFIVIFGDTYTQPVKEKLVWIAQLNISSNLAFAAAFIPLFLLSNKCLFITIDLVRKMRTEYFETFEFIQTVLSQTNTNLISYQAQLRGFKNQKSLKMEVYDDKGNIQLNVSHLNVHTNTVNKAHPTMRIACLSLMSLLYFVLGIQVLVYTTTYLSDAEQYCYQITESKYFDGNGTYTYNKTLTDEENDLLTRHSELFLWHKCLYQVYPFVGDDVDYKCQCRVFVLDWETDLISKAHDRHTYLNITQPQLLAGVMQQWYMMEKFSTKHAEGSISAAVKFNPDMFRARMLRAFSWVSLSIAGIDANASVRLWSHLEYFHIENTNYIRSLPHDFDQLQSLKYFTSILGGLTEFPPQLCSLPNLKVIQIDWSSITTIPHCVADLRDLEQFHINAGSMLARFPLALLTLPNLQDVSLWKAPFLTFENLLAFNNINDDTNASLEEYFDAHFAWNDDANYYFSLTPLCDDLSRNQYPTKLEEFLNKKITNSNTTTTTCTRTCAYRDGHMNDMYCPPYVLGDGKCDFGCNSGACDWDHGDCNQLCFHSAFSDCTMDLFRNDVCDEECNNIWCTYSNYGSKSLDTNTFYADNYNCVTGGYWEQNRTEQNEWAAKCYPSRYHNIYTTEFTCPLTWVADGYCDDACRTDECENDKGDCDSGCVDDACNLMLNAWATVAGRNDVYLLSIEEICGVWPALVIFFNIHPNTTCPGATARADKNNDEHINFREYMLLANLIWASQKNITGWVIKGEQQNCSACVGMEHYNDMYTP